MLLHIKEKVKTMDSELWGELCKSKAEMEERFKEKITEYKNESGKKCITIGE